jgi:prophage regulatory protein
MPSEKITKPETLLRRPDVRARTGLSDTRIDELEKKGRFPQRVQVSSRAIAWVQSEIDAFIAERIAAREERSIADKTQTAA